MNTLAIVGSPRKNQATDTLVDKAIEGVLAHKPGSTIKKLNLSDYNITYCRNCLICRDTKATKAYSDCVIKDDMAEIYEHLASSDALIFGTPVHSSYPTALMMMFLERITWTFAKPEKSYFHIHGCPTPKSDKKRKSIIIIVSGVVPPAFRLFCDNATRCIKDITLHSLNARTVGAMYAGAVENRGVDSYFQQARKLGRKLV